MTTSPAAVQMSHAGAHPRDLLAWHALCFAAMGVMLVATVPGRLATAGLVAFGVGTAWCAVQAARTATRGGAYLRLGVCCSAMVVMLLPLVPTSGQVSAPVSGGRHAGHTMEGPTAASALGGAAVPALLTALVLAALAVVVLASARHLVARGASRPGRLAAALEAVLSGGMGAMLLALH